MQEILTRAGCFVAIIMLGYVLRRMKWFKDEDFGVISTIVLKVTLPAAIIISFHGREIDASLLAVVLLGLGCGVVYMVLGFLINLRKSKEQRAFDVLNLPGYNIGNFTLPFVQSFLGPEGVIITSLFDTGNAIVCLGGAYGVASLVKAGSGFSVKRILKTLLKSIPFDTYLVMLVLGLLRLSIPEPVASLAQTVANASPFMAMFMIGVGFHLQADREHVRYIVKYMVIRYGLAAVLSYVLYHFTGFSPEIRQTLAILVFAPFCTSAPAFTGEMGEDVGLSSAINSISIVISVVIMITLLTVLL